MNKKLGLLLIAFICQLISLDATESSIDTFVIFRNLENSKFQFANVEECQQDCLSYDECEAFLYYDDYRCFLFHLNKNISALNEKITTIQKKNYIYGFKSEIFTKKLTSVDLGAQYSHITNATTLEQCLQKCLLYGDCFGVSLDDKNVCKIYDNTPANHTIVKGSEYVSYVLNNKNAINELGLSIEQSLLLEDYELKGSYRGGYAISAEQCWKFCENDNQCTASSYLDEFHRANQKILNIFNCYFYDDKFEITKNKLWTSYVDIKDYSILSPDDKKFENLEIVGSYNEINIRKCINKCDIEKKCYSLSFDVTNNDCNIYSKLSRFSQKKTTFSRKPNLIYLNRLTLFDEPCGENKCDTDAGLQCIDDVCRCADLNQYWSGDSETCKQCTPGWTPLLNTCWRYFNELLNYNDASSHCKKNQDSSLIILDNPQKFASYRNIIKQNVDPISENSRFSRKWVRATKTRPQRFEWIIDGSEVDLSFSMSGLSRRLNNSGEYCGGFDASVGDNLNDMFCFNKADFICEFECISFDPMEWIKDKTKDVLNLDDTPRRECRKCKDNSSKWKSYPSLHSEETCYQYFSLPDGRDFYEAKKFCEDRKTHLLELRNRFKFNDFQKIFENERKKHHSKPEHVKAWLGLTAVRPYTFYWGNIEEKFNVESDFWARNLPDNGDKVCVAYDASDSYSLNNFNCYSLYNFFCEASSADFKCPAGYGKYKDSCFMFFDSVNMLKTWYGAKSYCESKNMNLMTIKDKEKFNTVQSYFKNKSNFKNKAWIGAAKILSSNIKWNLIDGRTIDIDKDIYIGAIVNSPESNKNCAALDGYNQNKLNAFDCNMKTGFFCEHY